MRGTGIAPPTQDVPGSSARLLNLTLLVTLAIGAMLMLVMGANAQLFSAAGASRRVVLPLVYLLVALIILRVGLTQRRITTGPVWLWFPLVGSVVSFAINIGTFGRTGLPINAVQGFLLLGGFSLVGICGAVVGRWPELDRRLLLVILAVFALVAVSLPAPALTVTPYAAVVVPGVFTALLLALKGKEHRFAWGLTAVVVGALGTRALHPAPGLPISIAVLGQIGVCSAIVLTTLMPRQIRVAAMTVGAVAIVGLALTPTVRDYLSGHYTGTDVTLAQRAYEAQQVEHSVQQTNLGFVVGRGPAATVDLTSSPDRETLLISGRDLTRVDDVHLITAYTLLKLGLCGLLWLVWLLVVVFRMLWAELSTDRLDLWKICLILYATSGLVAGFPAGTELFSNPLLPLLLGVLWAEGRPVAFPVPHLLAGWATRSRLASAPRHARPLT